MTKAPPPVNEPQPPSVPAETDHAHYGNVVEAALRAQRAGR